MLCQLLKDIEIGGFFVRHGTHLALSPADQVQADGSLRYYFSPGLHIDIPAGQFKIIYSSYDEMLKALERERKK